MPLLDKDLFRNLKVLKRAGPQYVLNRTENYCLKRALNFLTQILIIYHIQLNRFTIFTL